MANVLPAVLGVASFIQGTNQQKKANKRADKAANQQAQVTQEQLEFFLNQIKPYAEAGGAAGKNLAPGIAGAGQKALDIAANYDPETEIKLATEEYDRSLKRDVNNTRVPIGLRGLKDSSEDATQTGAVMNRRAFDLSKIRASLPQMNLNIQGQAAGIGAPAFQTLNPAAISQGAAGSLPGAAQTMGNMANQNYAQAAAINPFKSLQGLNWDWLKMKQPKAVTA